MKAKDLIITSFNQVNFRRLKMPFIVLYDHPKDYSNSFVARLFDTDKPTNIVIIGEDLDKLRSKIPRGMIKFDRANEDDKSIIESYC